jgi:TRAP-type transport system small permease protein
MKRIVSFVDRSVEGLVVIVFAAMIAAGAAQVFNRYFLNVSLSWSEEFQRYGQIWLVFLAIPIAYRRGMHMGIDGLRKYLGTSGKRRFLQVIDILWLVLAGAILTGTLKFMGILSTQRSAGLNLPMNWVYLGIVIGSLYMILVGVTRLLASFAGKAVADLYDQE